MPCFIEFPKSVVGEIIRKEGISSFIENAKIVGGCPVKISSGETRGITIFAITKTSFLHVYYDYPLKKGRIRRYHYTKLGKFLLNFGIWYLGMRKSPESIDEFENQNSDLEVKQNGRQNKNRR